MSNPFLKSKEPNKINNRFNFLDDDNTNRQSIKEHSNKSNKRNEYEPSQNSFTQSSKPRIDQYKNKDTTYYRENKEKREPSPPFLFDYLEPIIETSTKYKDILINVIKYDTLNANLIPPGWTEITRLNGKTVFKHGPPTLRQQKQEKQKELENDQNYRIVQMFDSLKKNWELNEKIYNSINGEGAYAEKFRLSPVYGSEYDSPLEEDEEYSDEDNY